MSIRRKLTEPRLTTKTLVALLCTVLSLGVSFGLGQVAHAATTNYYVDCVGGSNSNNGLTTGTAWQTNAKVSGQTFSPGSVIHFKRGCTWSTGYLNMVSSGTSADPITITDYGTGALPTFNNNTLNHGVWVQGTYYVIENIKLVGFLQSGVNLRSTGGNSIVRNVEVTDAGTAIRVYSQNNLLTHNYAHDLKMVINTITPTNDDSGAAGYIIYADNNELSYSSCVNCIADSYDYGKDGGFVEIFNGGSNAYIHNNYSDNTEGFLEAGGNGGYIFNDARIENNLITNVHGGMCLHVGGSWTGTFDNLQFTNNTFISASTENEWALNCWSSGVSANSLKLKNNIFQFSGSFSSFAVASNPSNNHKFSNGVTTTFTHENNLYYMTNSGVMNMTLNSSELTGDPKFVNPAGGDYSLQASSPAVNAGTSGGPTTDYDDATRTGTADLGAFEYVTPPTTTTTTAPTTTTTTAPTTTTTTAPTTTTTHAPTTTTTTAPTTTTTHAPTTTTTTIVPPVPTPAPGLVGYRLATNAGKIYTYGDLTNFGDVSGCTSVVGIAATPNSTGLWAACSDGQVKTLGAAGNFGSMAGQRLAAGIIGITSTGTGNGYWLLASDGGIFSFGDAKFYGSTGAIKLNMPVVAMAATASGHGYWLIATDGGIFSFGDATFYGSTGAIKLNKPVVSAFASSSGHGYWLVASDGGIFSFGDAKFYGSTGAIKLNKPIVGMASAPSGKGYWLVASDGGIFSFGEAPFRGSAGSEDLKSLVGSMTNA